MSQVVKLVCIAVPNKNHPDQDVQFEEFTITHDDWQDDEPEDGETFEEYVDYSINEVISEWEQRLYSAVVMTREQYDKTFPAK